ncbi:FAD-dependent monooxygenase [Kribbella deserti]|uniref:FAD-dependent monooxygenase n=1 Tax=Kribbella deserti TaxID=1926257 RepID=A0ABV6QDM9_9ACTN
MTKVLISGASVAGPVLAYWLKRYGFEPTVVERAPALRHSLGGHAIDLFGPAMEVAERMGLLTEVYAARTGTKTMTMYRPGRPPIDADVDRLAAGISSRHVEIMRGELTKLLYDASADDVEYIFGDSIASLDDDGEGVDVTFEQGEPRRFDLVIGADGLHSNVRRLAFGPEASYLKYLGGYLAVYTVPNYLGLDGQMLVHPAIGKLVGTYPVHQTGQARALFLWRRPEPLSYDYRDVDQQKDLLRQEFAGSGWEVPKLFSYLDEAEDFYLDSISQITLDHWHRGRVALVGDAGYSPGPAVGGGTSLAMVTAYVLAGELASYADPVAGLRAYEDQVRDFVLENRKVGPSMMKALVPTSKAGVWLTVHALHLINKLPTGLQNLVTRQSLGFAKALDSIELKDYQPSKVG